MATNVDSAREEEVLQRIVLTREQQSLRRLERSLLGAVWAADGAAAAGGEDDTNVDALSATATADLARFQLQAMRLSNYSAALLRETEASVNAKAELERLAGEVESDIVGLRATLERENREKSHREQYTALAKVVSALTSRSSSQREIENVAKIISELEAEGRVLAGRREQLAKRFMLLNQTIDEMTASVQDDAASAASVSSAPSGAGAAAAEPSASAPTATPTAAPSARRTARATAGGGAAQTVSFPEEGEAMEDGEEPVVATAPGVAEEVAEVDETMAMEEGEEADSDAQMASA